MSSPSLSPNWGHAGQMNVAFSLWGCLSGAGLEVWDRHLEELLTLFAGELHEHGGPRLDVEELNLHMESYAAMMGLAYFLDSPARILMRLPEVVDAAGTRDPVLQKSETVRNQLHMSQVFLNLWQTHDLGASLQRLLRRLPAAAAGDDCDSAGEVYHTIGPRGPRPRGCPSDG
jgi:hypothetical protein